MKKIFLLFTVLISLAGCASKPAYRAAEDGGYGYTDSQLSDTQYRVHFKARGSDKRKAMDYAMLRAAELTLKQGFEWFNVTERETLVDEEEVQVSPQVGFSRRYATVTDCGVLSCRTSRYPTSQFETGIFVGGSQQSEIESIINFEMGRGDKPTGGNAFDAQQVVDNLKPDEE